MTNGGLAVKGERSGRMRERLAHSISRSTAVKFLMMEKGKEEEKGKNRRRTPLPKYLEDI